MRKNAIGTFVLISICILAATFASSCSDTHLTASSTATNSEIISKIDNPMVSSATTSSTNASKNDELTTSSTETSSEIISKEKQKKYEEIQNSVDNGHEPGRLDPEEVSMDFASTTLKIADFGKTYDKIEKNMVGDKATVIFNKSGKVVMKIELYQPVKKGTGGIWVVTGWTDSKTNTKHTVE